MPSLYTLHGKDCDWTLYNPQTTRMHAHLTAPFNPDRDGVAHQLEGGNLDKVDFATSSCLIHLAVTHQWEGPLSYDWLLEHDHFDSIYTTYAEYLREIRGNDCAYIAKQLGDLQHSLAWASLQEWEWGTMPAHATTLVMNKLDSLKRQYYSEGSKRSQVCRSIVRKPAEQESNLQSYVAKTNELVDECLGCLCDKSVDDITDEDKADVVECTMLKLAARGGRGVDLHAVWISFDQDWILEWLCDNPRAEDTNFVVRREDTWELVLYSKGHFIHVVLEDATALLDLFCRCFPCLGYGDRLFNPTYHGVRSSRHRVQEYFTTTAKFDEVFEGVCERRIGVRIRPYALRRYNATNLHRLKEASDEVRRSHCSAMGTGIGNLETTYDDRSDPEKGHLASSVQRFGDDPRFDPEVYNRLVPTLGPRGGVVFMVARMVRQARGTETFALFDEVEPGYFELSTRMIQSDQAQGFPSAKLVPDALSNRQRWRARDAAVQDAEDMMNEAQINRHEFAVNSAMMAPPSLQPKDMVYVPVRCAIAEVLEVSDDETLIKVRLATELEATNSMEAVYRFAHDAEVQQVRASGVTFPIDLTFHWRVGDFVLRKSVAMETI